MSFSLVNYAASWLPSSPEGDTKIRVVQAAEADVMEAGIEKALAEIVALNATIAPLTGLPSPPWPSSFTSGNKFVLADATLAGGGDGHTFICTLQFQRYAIASNELLSTFLAGFSPDNGGTPPALAYTKGSGLVSTEMEQNFAEFFDPALLKFKACLAGDGAAFQSAFEDMTARLRAAFPNLNGVLAAPYQSVAGAAKGTRFMAVVGGYQT